MAALVLVHEQRPLFFFAIARQPETARRMIEDGADLNQLLETHPHPTPLLYALQNDQLHTAQLLIEHGANVLQKDAVGMTPLHVICSVRITGTSEEEKYNVCKLLLESGADYKSRDANGLTQLHYALSLRSLEVVKLLVDHGADITELDGYSQKALHRAATNPHVNVLEFILNQTFDIECSCSKGWSPLHYAALCGNSEGCQLLLKRGANVNRRTGHGGNRSDEYTPLILAVGSHYDAAISGRARTVQVLLDNGADMEDDRGHSILKLAAYSDRHQFGANLKSYTEDAKFVLMRHVVRMEHMDLRLTEDDQRRVKKYRLYHGYYQFCKEELERMKGTKIWKDVSVFNILMDSKEAISGYARNEELMKALEGKDYDNEFPVYFTLLKKKFYAEVLGEY